MSILKTFATVGLAMAFSANAQTMDHSKMDHAAHMAKMADAQRQSEVANRGKDVMPFTLAATTHIFTKGAQGGVMKVVAKKSSDTSQVKLVRNHLQEIHQQFLQGDFSGPSHIHGQDMPGLGPLRAAKPGQIDIAYKEVLKRQYGNPPICPYCRTPLEERVIHSRSDRIFLNDSTGASAG